MFKLCGCKDNSFFQFMTWTASHVHSWITVKYGLNWNDIQTFCCTSFPARIELHISTKEYWDVSQRKVDVFMVSEMKIHLGIYIAICRSFLFILAFLCNYCVLCFIKSMIVLWCTVVYHQHKEPCLHVVPNLWLEILV
jgi:hypothetical protein